MSADGVNWTTIFDASVNGSYAELYGGKSFYTFSPFNIVFTTVDS